MSYLCNYMRHHPPLPNSYFLVGACTDGPIGGEERPYLPFPVEAPMVTIWHVEGVSPSVDLSLKLLQH